MWPFTRDDPRIAEELRFHRQALIDAYVAEGLDRREAERRAFLELGNVAGIEEHVRDVRGRWLDDLGKDLRYAFRTLRKNPVFTLVGVVSLALGIGANTAIFSLVNAVMLRTLPVSEPDRLVRLARLSSDPRVAGYVSYPIFAHWRDNLTTVMGVFAQAKISSSAVVDGEQDYVDADLVSGAYTDVLGLRPALGRLLDPADDVVSAPVLAAVITDGFWQRRFGRNPSALGKTVTLRRWTFTIVGVTPPGFGSAESGRRTDLLLPLNAMLDEEQRASIGSNNLGVLARLAPGATVEQANAEVDVLFRAFIESRSAGMPDRERTVVLRQRSAALPAPDGFNPVRSEVARPLVILMGIVGLILLLVCINLSGLLFARAAARRREISIRLAIGASRGRLVRQLLTESLVLAVLGGSFGFVAAGWFSDMLFAEFVSGRDIALSVSPDVRVLGFTVATGLAACLIAGLAPALQGSQAAPNPAREQVSARGLGRLGKALVVAQLATSMVLVVAATLFVGTLVNLHGVDRGFDSRGVLVISLRSATPFGPERGPVVQRLLRERIGQLPGIVSASAVQALPLSGNLWDRTVQVDGYTFRPNESNSVGFNAIAPAYFFTIGTPLRAGREFDERDTATGPKVAIVNESFERYFFGTAPAIGRQVTSVGVTYTIVGVVGDAIYQSLRDAPLRTMYVPWTQREDDPPTMYSYLARVERGDPLRLAPDLERAVRAVDPSLQIARLPATYDTVINRSIATERILAALGALFGLLALVVAGLGLFGVLALQVTARLNELGVRLVLGASGWMMAWLILRDVAMMVVPGLVIGTALALAATDVARSVLFGLTPSEPGVFVVSAAVLSATALLAAWLPARRAARADPLVVLRYE